MKSNAQEFGVFKVDFAEILLVYNFSLVKLLGLIKLNILQYV